MYAGATMLVMQFMLMVEYMLVQGMHLVDIKTSDNIIVVLDCICTVLTVMNHLDCLGLSNNLFVLIWGCPNLHFCS